MPTPIPTPTPVPLPDLQTTDIEADYIQFNNDDGTKSYGLTITGIYGATRPNSLFNIQVNGMEGLIDPIHHLNTYNRDGTFVIKLPEFRLPPGSYSITVDLDVGNLIVEKNENNNTSPSFFLLVEEPPTYTIKEWEYFEELAFQRGDATRKNLTKFKDPIRVSVLGGPTPRQRQYLDERINIAQELGFDILYADQSNDSNFVVYLNVERSEIPIILPKASAKAMSASGIASSRESDNEILSCLIIVVEPRPGDPDFYFLNTISEEFFQCLAGLTFDGSTRYPESIIAYGRHQFLVDPLPDIDLRVIQLAGEDVLEPGMTKEQVKLHIRVENKLP